jgi:hypothetical protein
LLSVAAEIEHSLMVEYLFAAFSLGGPQVPKERQDEVAQWQEVILGIAKEEMGHLLTIQNLLRCIGGPLNLSREDFPWDSDFYPFPFQLEPLTRPSLAKYVYAESPAPDQWTGEEADSIRALAQQAAGGAPFHRVGALYDELLHLFADTGLVRDSDFRDATYPFQSNWDEWGRGYQGGARGNARRANLPGTPDVIVMPVVGRSDAVSALTAIATQGEAPVTANEATPSHFARFLNVFRRFPQDDGWSPSRKVAVNPVVGLTADGTAADPTRKCTPLTNPPAALWGHLFNIRYRVLLSCLLHTFDYSSNLAEASERTPRGLLVHATFGEMYNIRALAHTLVQIPADTADTNTMAGPPFQIPFTLDLPRDSLDRWRLHLDLLAASKALAGQLLAVASERQKAYLVALNEGDTQIITVVQEIARGLQLRQ